MARKEHRHSQEGVQKPFDLRAKSLWHYFRRPKINWASQECLLPESSRPDEGGRFERVFAETEWDSGGRQCGQEQENKRPGAGEKSVAGQVKKTIKGGWMLQRQVRSYVIECEKVFLFDNSKNLFDLCLCIIFIWLIFDNYLEETVAKLAVSYKRLKSF